jgi:ribosomal protein S8
LACSFFVRRLFLFRLSSEPHSNYSYLSFKHFTPSLLTLRACTIILEFLPINSNMLAHPSASGYIGEVEIIDDRRAGKVVVNLIGRLNKCGVISPRFDVGLKDIEKWTNNLLPSRQFGKLVLTTSAGST